MSTKTLKDEKKLPKQIMFSKKCLGIVLKRITTDKAASCECESAKNSEFHHCSSENGCSGGGGDDWMYESGYLIYQEFQEENRQCFWNTILVDSVSNVEYMGYVAPGTLLICGNEYYLEAVRSAWARRVLRSPANFIITRLGDVTGLEIQVIPQTQFTPLPEALCLVVSELNLDKQTASLDVIFTNLQDRFSDMIIPNQEVVYSSLGKLIKDRKVYHTGDGYFIVTPETYHMTTVSTLPERPLLMSNEEAIHKLHGGELVTHTRTRSIQANMTNSDEDLFVSSSVTKSISSDRHLSMPKLDRTGSLRLSRKEKHRSEEDNTSFARSESMKLSPEKSRSLIKDINLKSSPFHREVEKGEKVSMFSKLFRRSSSKRRKNSKSPAKYATFSAQFPPVEWSDPDVIHYHSRSTQTLLKESRSLSPSKNTLSVGSPAVTSSSSISINHNNNNNQSVMSNNVISSNGNSNHYHHHVHNCNSNATSPPPVTSSASTPATNAVSNTHLPMKCKTDSLTRLKDSTHPHHRARSSSRFYSQATSDSKTQTGDRLLSRKGTYYAGSTSELSPATKIHSSSSPSSAVGHKNAFTSSRSSVLHLVSPARSSKPHDAKSASGPKSLVTSHLEQDNLHSSATSLNKVETRESKLKNTDVRNDEDIKLSDLNASELSSKKIPSSTSYSSKYNNRWSVHGTESGSLRAPMNNVGLKNGHYSSSSKQPKIKCVNKLNQTSSGGSSSAPNRSQNVTAAVRPTQAIKPMNQYVDKSSADRKIHNLDDDSGKLVSSPSFNKSFDLESTEFKSLTAIKLLKGISVNSIDTLVEVNMAANEQKVSEEKEELQGNSKTSAP